MACAIAEAEAALVDFTFTALVPPFNGVVPWCPERKL